ncbi:hypothetical protein G4Y73_00075 [Wenzhouxiangella sp. XN201]|uniref:hypothetical protein n=1 Tax=Wenzhouxiangella sp. XN201 TaxID=2710755 RepID=UPI0013C78F82|nr:hypothetical protein [Wenzhouxiangella sp. XN201]NEZ02539.1 hypothetical protein [Wenzhouxiangella sp. XN201]
MRFAKWASIFGIVVTLVAIALSWGFGVAYYYTLLGFLGWLVAGHLLTLDDEEPGGFSNPDGSRGIWRSSLLELAAKASVLAAAVLLLVLFPSLHKFGAS